MKTKKTNKSTKATSKSNKAKAKAASKVVKSTKEPKLDQWGFEVGSTQAKVNKLLSREPQTVREIADKGDINHRRVRYQCRVLTRLKLAKRTGDGYAWAKKSK